VLQSGIQWAIAIIGGILSILYAYKYIYVFLGLFFTRHFPPAEKYHRYAILIAARNEATVLSHLLESIAQQDYHTIAPGKLDVFVVADNSTDNTAEIARKNGAFCYERFDKQHCTKGFALQFLVEKIRQEFGLDSYDGYIIFDADNLLAKDYVSRMNDSFDNGNKIICSYRNTKNFDSNWIAASYAIHFLRTVRNEHRARSYLRMPTRIQGTGFLVAAEIIRNGWNYTSLTEDRALSADAVVNGYDITYNHDAVFYDEQPTSLHIAMRQRIRWSKGHLQAFAESGGKLFRHIFRKKELYNSLRNYDMLMTIFPRQFFSALKRILSLLLKLLIVFHAFTVWNLTAAVFTWFFAPFAMQWFYAAYVLIFERKRLPCVAWYRKIWYIFMFPLFDVLGRLSMLIALVIRVEWKPIPHNESVRLSDIKIKE